MQFHGVLEELGFTRTYSDAGVYVCHRHERGDALFVILYVDDITILGSSLDKIKDLKESLSSRYEMTDLGEIHQTVPKVYTDFDDTPKLKKAKATPSSNWINSAS